jgi:phosphoglycerate dehydrogenase-like enzyme
MTRAVYLSLGPPELYALIREELPGEVALVTLERGDLAERCARVRGCRIAITAGHRLERQVIEAADRLELVHHQGVGYQDTVDLDALRQRGIRLALTPEGTTVGVAEHTVLLILALYKRLTFADAELRAGRWHVNSLRMGSRELAGRRVGYVGMGRIGEAVAERLAAFATTGLYHDPARRLDPAREAALGLRPADLAELLEAAEIVTLHCPLTAATRHLIDARALARMRGDAILVNTSRGPLVDEAALAAALADGRIAGAALDVFESEPLPPTSPLLRAPNTVLTPHIAAGTRDAMRAKMRAIAANLRRFLAGEALANEVML